MSKVRTGGGRFNPKEASTYFLAGNASDLDAAADVHDHLLIAVNELKNEGSQQVTEALMDRGHAIFLDSGIFNLTNEHKRAHNISMDEALSLAPNEIDGFDDLWKRYVALATRWEKRLWGYIELDQGGRDNKIKTRTRLEMLGLNPIPVYHPLNDGWDYFDYLAERYDRICLGNVVQADVVTRKRLIATMWERHRKFPDLWIHLLGFTPNHLLYALPINSGDSSAWLGSVRWSGYLESAGGTTLSEVSREFRYIGGEDAGRASHRRAKQMAAYGAHMVEHNWRQHLAVWRDLGCVIYPEVPA